MEALPYVAMTQHKEFFQELEGHFLQVPPKARETRYAALMKREGEIVAPGTMILKFRSLEAILTDPKPRCRHFLSGTSRVGVKPKPRPGRRSAPGPRIFRGLRPPPTGGSRGDTIPTEDAEDRQHRGSGHRSGARDHLSPVIETLMLSLKMPYSRAPCPFGGSSFSSSFSL